MRLLVRAAPALAALLALGGVAHAGPQPEAQSDSQPQLPPEPPSANGTEAAEPKAGAATAEPGASLPAGAPEQRPPPRRPESQAPAAPDFGSILDNWPLLLAALLAGLIGGVLGGVLPLDRTRRREEMKEVAREVAASKASQLQRELNAISARCRDDLKHLGERLGRAELRLERLGQRADPGPEDHLDGMFVTPEAAAPSHAVEPAAIPVPAAPVEPHESQTARALGEAYADFLAGSGGARQFSAMISGFGAAHALRRSAEDQFVLEPYSGDDPEERLVAIADAGSFLVVPAYEYIAQFRTFFHVPLQNPPEVQHFFALLPDGGGRLQMAQPGTARRDGGGRIELIRKGELRGFSV